MSSYAKAAKENKPATQGKPATTNTVPPVGGKLDESEPHGSVEVIPDEKLKEFTPKLEDTKDSKKAHKLSEAVEKELEKAKESTNKAAGVFDKIYQKLSEGFKALNGSANNIGVKVQSYSGCVAERTVVELKNPVVVTQLGVAVAGIVGGYFAYLERSRINTSNKAVLAIHGSIITGLVIADGLLFQKYYPKYKKN